MRTAPLVAIVNHSTVVTPIQVAQAVPALQAQVTQDFKPLWNADALVQAFSNPADVPKDAWVLGLFDTSDQAGALGYHDVTKGGLPLGKVFVKDDLKYGASWTVTVSHELLELLADPFIASAIQVSNTTFIALEVCDAVEADELGYTHPGLDGKPVQLSDFITPRWFDALGATVAGEGYDFKKHLTKPRTLASGGYVSIYVAGQGWTQKQAQHAAHYDDTTAVKPVGHDALRHAAEYGQRGSQRCLRGRAR